MLCNSLEEKRKRRNKKNYWVKNHNELVKNGRCSKFWKLCWYFLHSIQKGKMKTVLPTPIFLEMEIVVGRSIFYGSKTNAPRYMKFRPWKDFLPFILLPPAPSFPGPERHLRTVRTTSCTTCMKNLGNILQLENFNNSGVRPKGKVKDDGPVSLDFSLWSYVTFGKF